jgi:uncharacterized lipoprotein YmbA
LGLLGGCQSPTVSPEEIQLHTVSSETVAPVTTVAGQGVPVAYQLAVVEHLNKPELLVRIGPKLDYSDRHQWAEPLSEGLERLVRIRLSSVPGVSRVLGAGRESGDDPPLRVMVRVDRFEGEKLPDGLNRAVVDAGWRIVRLDQPSAPVLASGVFVREDDTWDGKDYERLKHLLRDLASDLAEAVAGSLEQAVEPFQKDRPAAGV